MFKVNKSKKGVSDMKSTKKALRYGICFVLLCMMLSFVRISSLEVSALQSSPSEEGNEAIDSNNAEVTVYQAFSFESEDADVGLPTGWQWNNSDNGVYTSFPVVSVSEDPVKSDNKVLKLDLDANAVLSNETGTGTNTFRQAWVGFSPIAIGSAVLEYDFYIASGGIGNTYLPAFSNGSHNNTPNSLYVIANGRLCATYGGYLNQTLSLDTWHTMRIVADFTNSVADIFVDGLYISEIALNSVSGGVSTIWLQAYLSTDAKNTLYLDDIEVSEFVAPCKILGFSLEKTNLQTGEKTQGTINVSDVDRLISVTYHSSNTNVAAVDNEGVITGIGAGEATITVLCTFDDGLSSSKQITLNVTQGDIFTTFDFQGETADNGLPTGWEWNNMNTIYNSFPAASIVADPTNQDNTVFALELDANSVRSNETLGDNTKTWRQAWTKFSNIAVESAVLEYDFYVPSGGAGNIYLPAFSNGAHNNTPNSLYVIANGRLCATYGGYLDKTVVLDEWHTMKITADFSASLAHVYLDGLFVAEISLNSVNGGVSTIWLQAYLPTDAENTLYLDNIKVSKLHRIKAVNSFELSNDTIFVGESAEVMLDYVPTDAALLGVSYSSSDPSIAGVDSSGKITGYKEGVVTIAVTCVLEDGTSVIKTAELTVNKSLIGFLEDFESEVISWIASTTDTNAHIDIREDPDGHGNNILKLWTGDETARDEELTNKVVFRRELVNENNTAAAVRKAVLKYRFQTGVTSGGATWLPTFADNSFVHPVELTVIRGSLFVCTEESSTKHRVMSLGSNEWYELELMVDLDNQTYDLYIDGELLVNHGVMANLEAYDSVTYVPTYDENGHIQLVTTTMKRVDTNPSNPSALRAVEFGFYSGFSSFYIDDLRVIDYTAANGWSINNGAIETIAEGNQLVLDMEYSTDSGEEASCRSAEITSSDTSVATVDYNGNIIGLNAGTATITIQPNETGLVSKQITVTVLENIPVTNISGLENFSLPVGGHRFLISEIVPANASDQTQTYESSAPSVAFIDEWGEVWARSTGTATITVSAGSFEKQIIVTVNEPGVQKTITVNNTTELMAALQEIRQIDKTAMTGNIVVQLNAGYYQLSETLNLTEHHGGNGEYSVIFRGVGDVIIGGGLRINGDSFIKDNETGIYSVSVPAGTTTRQLFVDNVRAVRAKSDGKLVNASELFENNISVGLTSDNVEIASFQNQDGIEFVYMTTYPHFRAGLDHAVDNGNGTVNLYMDDPAWTWIQTWIDHNNNSASNCMLYYENALELLDEPGEWYLNESTNMLYYMPRPFENMSDVTVTLPVLDGLMTICGSSYDNVVQNILFENITFADATWMQPSGKYGHCASQNNLLSHNTGTLSLQYMPDGSIMVEKANSVSFTNCTFTRLGTTALYYVQGVQNSVISGNRFYDLSGGGLQIGDLTYGHAPNNDINNYNPRDIRRLLKNYEVENNYIHNTGVDFYSSSSIGIGFVANINITNNEIFSIPYSAITVGAGWNCKFENVQRNVKISGNFIHDYMKKANDGGGIYVIGNSGASEDNRNEVFNNYLTNMQGAYAPLYPDAGSTYWYFHDNVVDLSQMEAYPFNGAKPAWLLVNTYDHHIYVQGNYTTTNKTMISTNHTSDLYINNNIVCDPDNWPSDAQTIIDLAGLNTIHAETLRRNQVENIECNLPKSIDLKMLETMQIDFAFLTGKGIESDAFDVQVFYWSVDDTVASVSEDGLISATGKGITTVYAYVISNDILKVFDATVHVGGELSEIKLRDIETNTITVVEITSLQLDTYGITDQGHIVELDSVSYVVNNQTIATVSENGLIQPIALGNTTLTISGTLDGKVASVTYTIEVVEAGENVIAYGTPVLDGILDEDYLGSKQLDFGEVFHPSEGSSSDTDGYCYLLWDEDYLYVFAYVSDARVMSPGMEYINSTNHPWATDGVETYVMTTLDNPSGSMSKFACDAFGIGVYGHAGSAESQIIQDRRAFTGFSYNGVLIEGYQIQNPGENAVAGTDEYSVNGYIIEMTIPIYLAQGITDGQPKAGNQITFQIQVNDYDGGTPGQANDVTARKNVIEKYYLLPAEVN